MKLRSHYGARTIVLATGCFDLLHKGHVYFLKEAASQGDVLVVGVNTDHSVRELKGSGRPIITAADRSAVLAELRCVDHIFTFDGPCACEPIRLLRPDIFAVGTETPVRYPDEITAATEVNAKVHVVPRTSSTSTTGIIESIESPKPVPLISVIYVNWNTKNVLANSLESLRKHNRLESIEIIVVDNSSGDGTIEWLHRDWPDIKIVSLDKNVGFAVGNNKGAECATGEYLLLLNTDTIVLPTTLSGLMSVLTENPQVGCVGARHLNTDGTLQRSMDSFPNLEADFFTLTELHRLNWVARFLGRRHAWWSDHCEYREVDWVNGACMLIRRRTFEEVGGFDPRFFIYGEEVDLCYRIRKAGWKIVFSPDAEIIHFGGAAMDHVALRRLLLKYEGLVRFYDSHRSWLSRLAIRIVIAFTSICRAIAILLGRILPGNSKARNGLNPIISQLESSVGTLDALKAWMRITFEAIRIPWGKDIQDRT